MSVDGQLMGIEIPAEYGGSEASFTTAIIAIEELAKVDPSISVMADVHVSLPPIRSLITEYLGEHSVQTIRIKVLER